MIDVGLFLGGLYFLIVGKVPPKKNAKYVVQGWPLRVMGAILMLPLPLSFLVGFVYGYWLTTHGRSIADAGWGLFLIDVMIVALCALAVTIVRLAYRIPVNGSQREGTLAEGPAGDFREL
jgi:hypothetical protein